MKQSSFLVSAKEAGLLRFARNDDDYVLPMCFAMTGK
jgi:hypothetical protein